MNNSIYAEVSSSVMFPCLFFVFGVEITYQTVYSCHESFKKPPQ